MQPISALKTVFKKHSISVNGEHILRDGLFYANCYLDPEMTAEQLEYAERMLNYFVAGNHPVGGMLQDKKFSFTGSHGKQIKGFLQLHGDPEDEYQTMTGMLDEVTLHDLEHHVFPACLRFLDSLNQHNRKRPYPLYDVRLYCPVITGDAASLYSGEIADDQPSSRLMDIIYELVTAKVPEPIRVYSDQVMRVRAIRIALYNRLFTNGKSVDVDYGDIDAVLERFVPNLTVQCHEAMPSDWTTADDGIHWIFDSVHVGNPGVLLTELYRASQINRCTVSWIPPNRSKIFLGGDSCVPVLTIKELTDIYLRGVTCVEAPSVNITGNIAKSTYLSDVAKYGMPPTTDSDK